MSFELLKTPQGTTTEQIRQKLLAVPDAKQLSNSLSLEELTAIEEEEVASSAAGGRRFRLRTTTTNDDKGEAQQDDVNKAI